MYITFPNKNNMQITLENLYNNTRINTTNLTLKLEKEGTLKNEKKQHITEALKHLLISTSSDLWETPTTQLYSTYKIPKRTGGFREISAPIEPLKTFQKNFKNYLEQTCQIITHEAAHGYIKERSTFTAIKTHQNGDMAYFLKADIKDFFPACNLNLILTQLKKIYPLNILLQDTEYLHNFTKALQLCLKNEELPQGSPASPTLTNILMIPFDYELTVSLHKQGFIYTRYADDILISGKTKWNWDNTITLINKLFRKNEYTFTIKNEKTRFGSKNGSNWNLGLMLNKDNNITIGHEKKQKFRAAIYQFLTDHLTNTRNWSIIETQELMGLISYYKMIEPDYVNYVINKYNRKLNTNTLMLIKQILK